MYARAVKYDNRQPGDLKIPLSVVLYLLAMPCALTEILFEVRSNRFFSVVDSGKKIFL